MTEDLLNQVRRAAAGEVSARAATRHGIVTSYDPDNHAVKVALQPDGTLTGWLPLKSVWIGNGWGAFFAPSIGDAIEIDFQEANGGVGTAGYRFFNDEDRPMSVPAGEAWLVHKTGTSFKLTNDGKATIDDGHGATVTLNGDGTITSQASRWDHQGDVHVNGDVFAGTVSLKHHKHIGVQTGGGVSGEPQP